MIKKPDNSLYKRAEHVIAHGALTNSKRTTSFIKNVFPSHIIRGSGCYLYDSWGNSYLDFVGGLGTNIIGYGHPKVSEMVQKYLTNGPSLSLPTTLEIELAEKLCDFTGFDKIRFFKTGTEACMAAVRIARSNQPYSRIYSDGYHGWSDAFVSLMDQSPGKYEILVNQITDQKSRLHECDISIIEPLKLDPQKDKEMLTLNKTKHRIFDEIITGFRVPQNFVYKWWDDKPEILCLGKAMANGFPMSAVLMKKEYADKDWFCSGTYCGEIIGIAASLATLEEIKKKKIEDLWFYANRFMNNLNKFLKEIDVKIQGYGTRGFMSLETLNEALFIQESCKAGIIFGKAFFFNYAHLEANIEERTLNIINDIVIKIKRGDVKLEGEMPISPLKRY